MTVDPSALLRLLKASLADAVVIDAGATDGSVAAMAVDVAVLDAAPGIFLLGSALIGCPSDHRAAPSVVSCAGCCDSWLHLSIMISQPWIVIVATTRRCN